MSHAGAASSKGSGSRQLVLLLLGFVLVVASFTASSLYADSRLVLVATLSHEVSDDAMPGMMALGQMRREMMSVESALEEAVHGDRGEVAGAARRIFARTERRTRTYTELPPFPGGAEMWQVAQQKLEHVERDVARIEPEIATGALGAAEADIDGRLDPDEREVDSALATLIQFDEDQGKRAALAARSRLADERATCRSSPTRPAPR